MIGSINSQRDFSRLLEFLALKIYPVSPYLMSGAGVRPFSPELIPLISVHSS
jgi:hypothetical protein